MSLKALANKVLERDKRGTDNENNIHNLSQPKETVCLSSGTECDTENQLEQVCSYSSNGDQGAKLPFKNVSWRYFYNSHYDDLQKAYADTLDNKIIEAMAMNSTVFDYLSRTYPNYTNGTPEEYEARKVAARQYLESTGLPKTMTLQECEDYFQKRKQP